MIGLNIIRRHSCNERKAIPGEAHFRKMEPIQMWIYYYDLAWIYLWMVVFLSRYFQEVLRLAASESCRAINLTKTLAGTNESTTWNPLLQLKLWRWYFIIMIIVFKSSSLLFPWFYGSICFCFVFHFSFNNYRFKFLINFAFCTKANKHLYFCKQ